MWKSNKCWGEIEKLSKKEEQEVCVGGIEGGVSVCNFRYMVREGLTDKVTF